MDKEGLKQREFNESLSLGIHRAELKIGVRRESQSPIVLGYSSG